MGNVNLKLSDNLRAQGGKVIVYPYEVKCVREQSTYVPTPIIIPINIVSCAESKATPLSPKEVTSGGIDIPTNYIGISNDYVILGVGGTEPTEWQPYATLPDGTQGKIYYVADGKYWVESKATYQSNRYGSSRNPRIIKSIRL